MKNAEILAIEDEHITAMDIKHKFEYLGYKVLAIESNGRKAIILMRLNPSRVKQRYYK